MGKLYKKIFTITLKSISTTHNKGLLNYPWLNTVADSRVILCNHHRPIYRKPIFVGECIDENSSIADRVVVRRVEEETTSAGGIVLPAPESQTKVSWLQW